MNPPSHSDLPILNDAYAFILLMYLVLCWIFFICISSIKSIVIVD